MGGIINSKIIKVMGLFYCLLFAVSVTGSEREFPLCPILSSKLDALSYSMGESFVFSKGVASIWLNPSRMGHERHITFGVLYEKRNEEQGFWNDDISGILQIIGITYPRSKITFGLSYSVPYDMEMHLDCDHYSTILKNFSIGCELRTSDRLSIGGTLGILWGNSLEEDIWREFKSTVKGLQGSFGLSWKHSPHIETGLIIRTPFFLKGKCEEDYSGPNFWNGYGDTTFTKVFSIDDKLFYPITAIGISIHPCESFAFNTQLTYKYFSLDGTGFFWGNNEIDLNLGGNWDFNNLLSLRFGGYVMLFPSPESEFDNTVAITTGLGIKLPSGSIDIAVGYGESADINYLYGRNPVLLDMTLNF